MNILEELFDTDGDRRGNGNQPRKRGLRGLIARLMGDGDDHDDGRRRHDDDDGRRRYDDDDDMETSAGARRRRREDDRDGFDFD